VCTNDTGSTTRLVAVQRSNEPNLAP